MNLLKTNQTFPEIKCPVCGQNDVELYCVHMTGNHYQCKSTGKLLYIRFKTEIFFEEDLYTSKEYLDRLW